MKSNAHWVRFLVAGLAVGYIGAVGMARGDSGSWTSTTGGDWNVAGNWAGGTIAGGQDSTASFTGINITANQTVYVDEGRTIGHLRFGDTARTQAYGDWWFVDGATLTLDVSEGQPTIRPNIDRSDTGFANIIAILAGDDGLLLASGTQVKLSGANTYTGTTTVDGALVTIGHAQAFGSSVISLKSGSMGYRSGGSSITVGNALTLDGDFSFGNADAANSADGSIVFTGILSLNGDHTLRHLGYNGTASPVTFNSGAANGVSGSRLIISNGGPTVTRNNGVFILGGGSTYSGTTVIHGATLQLNGSLATTAGIEVNRGGTFNIYYDSAGNDLRLDNSIPIRLRGGRLREDANQSSGFAQWEGSETVGPVALVYGHSTIQAGGGRPRVFLTITNLVRQAGGTVCFSRLGSSSPASYSAYGYGKIYLTGQEDGFIGGWAIARRNEYVSGAQEDSGYDFGWYVAGSDRLTGVLPMSVAGIARAAQMAGAAAGDHVKAETPQTALSGDTEIATLLVTGDYDHDLGGRKLDIVGGGLLCTGDGDYEMSGGDLTSSGGGLFLFNQKNSGAMTISASITGAGVSVTTVGSQALAGSNSFGGALTVNDGTLTLSGANGGVGAVTVTPGATLQLGTAQALPASARVNLLYDGEEYGKVNNPYANLVVKELSLDGAKQPPGTYGATGSGAEFTDDNYFAGAGTLIVEPPSGTLIMVH
jgi:hypothetical protein